MAEGVFFIPAASWKKRSFRLGKEALRLFSSVKITQKEHVMPIREINDEDNFVIHRAAIAQTGVEPLQSLAAMISSQQRQRFLSKLFNGDAPCFERLLSQLEAAPTWSAAHRAIELCLQQQRISPYHAEATRFSSLVYKRYFPKDEHI
jgi:hypothetical protein